ncbi:MAG: ATP-dependent Clp protease proteolytic subunit [Alphaproteobacteria bacterium]|nr:ATP-dependent Clp protease proteolytic subunit [Alphaproteobacteria bacterium]
MPSWNEILQEMKEAGGRHDNIRRKYLRRLYRVTGRNAIIYYSGWLHKTDGAPDILAINDDDKNGFMAAVHKLDRSKGLDLILHTPGGGLAAVESIVDYLKQMFDSDIRAIVPQMAMSAGTMMACASKTIIMGKHSNIGPIDPQIAGVSAHALLDTWEEAKREIQATPTLANLWLPVLQRYPPGLLIQCRQSIEWASKLVKKWLIEGMFDGAPDADDKATQIVDYLSSHTATLSHARHVHRADARSKGLVVVDLEDDQKLQDAVLAVHHACMQTFTGTGAHKIIENHKGIAYIRARSTYLIQE